MNQSARTCARIRLEKFLFISLVKIFTEYKTISQKEMSDSCISFPLAMPLQQLSFIFQVRNISLKFRKLIWTLLIMFMQRYKTSRSYYYCILVHIRYNMPLFSKSNAQVIRFYPGCGLRPQSIRFFFF